MRDLKLSCLNRVKGFDVKKSKEVSGSSLGHTKDFKNSTYCSSVRAGHNELE